MASVGERDPAEMEILRIMLDASEGIPNIALMDALERRGVRPGDALRALRRLEAKGRVFSSAGRWRVTSAPAGD